MRHSTHVFLSPPVPLPVSQPFFLSNNLDDVRNEWERIKLSYEILRDPRSRKRYDRHEVLADPGAAVGRAVADAALGALGKGLTGVGSGIFALGAFAFDKLSDETKNIKDN